MITKRVGTVYYRSDELNKLEGKCIFNDVVMGTEDLVDEKNVFIYPLILDIIKKIN